MISTSTFAHQRFLAIASVALCSVLAVSSTLPAQSRSDSRSTSEQLRALLPALPQNVRSSFEAYASATDSAGRAAALEKLGFRVPSDTVVVRAIGIIAVSDPTPALRSAAVMKFRYVDSPPTELAVVLRDVVTSDPSARVRTDALTVLANERGGQIVNVPKAFDFLRKILETDTATTVRAQAATSLARYPEVITNTGAGFKLLE